MLWLKKKERNTNVEITFLRTYPKTSYQWRCSISACWIPQYRLHTSYGCKPYLKGSPVPWQKVPGTFEKNRPYTRGRKIQTAYNASSHYHSIVQENCLSPVLSDSGTALETHPNSFLLLSLFRLEVRKKEKNTFSQPRPPTIFWKGNNEWRPPWIYARQTPHHKMKFVSYLSRWITYTPP